MERTPDCTKCHGKKQIPLGVVAGVAPCDRCDGTGVDPDSDLTPAQSPDAIRRRSSRSIRAPVKCPACAKQVAALHQSAVDLESHKLTVHCTLCWNPTVGGCTRYVDPDKAEEWRLKNLDRDTDPAPPTDKEPDAPT